MDKQNQQNLARETTKLAAQKLELELDDNSQINDREESENKHDNEW